MSFWTQLVEVVLYSYEMRVSPISNCIGLRVVVDESDVIQCGECIVVEMDCNLRLVYVVTPGERGCNVIKGSVVFGRVSEVCDN